jgi:hypothetical protein
LKISPEYKIIENYPDYKIIEISPEYKIIENSNSPLKNPIHLKSLLLTTSIKSKNFHFK